MSKFKLLLFWIVTATIVIAAPVAILTGYYGYRKATFPYEFCGSYGATDPVLGWTLLPGATSCVNGRDRFSGEQYFTSNIRINRDGFRDATSDSTSPPNAVVTIGDSWTFGYGVNFEDTYPHFLSLAAGVPTVNLGVPAYGSSQTLLRFERHVDTLRPRAVIYLTIGLWQRSVCNSPARPTDILKPCYWWDASRQRIELVEPAAGYVERMARQNVFPGGYLTAGADSWAYFMISRPILKVREWWNTLARLLGIDDADRFPVEKMLALELDRFARLAKEHGFVFILLDPDDAYRAAYEGLDDELRRAVVRIGAQRWSAEVTKPSFDLPAAERQVPHDGHFGPGTNRLIAALVARVLKNPQN